MTAQPPPADPNSDRNPTADNGAYLVLRSAGRWSDVFRLTPPVEVVLGRASSNQIVIRDQQASRHHAKVFWNGTAWVLVDLGSVNGTFLNQSRISSDQGLHDGDVIRVGGCEITYSVNIPGLSHPVATDQGQATDDQMTVEMDTGMITERRRHSAYLSGGGVSEVPEAGTSVSGNAGSRDASEESGSMSSQVDASHRLLLLAFQLARADEPSRLIEMVLDDLAGQIHFDSAGLYLAKAGSAKRGQSEIALVSTRQSGQRSYRRPPDSLTASISSGESEAILARNILGDPEMATENSQGEIDVESLILTPLRDRDGQCRGMIHLTTSRGTQPLQTRDLEYVVAVGEILTASLIQLNDRRKLARSLRQTKQQVKELQRRLGDKVRILGDSQSIQDLVEKIGLAAPTPATVLVRGESGVGKELVAAAIHHASNRSDGPLICLNCAALSPTLLESELFGHEKGAFTGATERKSGKFELANGGTLMLDEIGEMDIEIQAKFLRVLEGHSFERVGGQEAIRVDVRVVAATNRDLQQMVDEKRFRQDLYYRLHVVELLIPPLRERGRDCLLIAEHFLQQLNHQMGRKITGFSDEAQRKLMSYPWPGNVRELRNVVERAVVLNTKSIIDSDDLSLSPTLGSNLAGAATSGQSDRSSIDEDSPEISLADLERLHINRVLQSTGGNKSRAASILGIERSTLDRKLKRYQQSR
ncbi:MAG: sigma 54-interacting transcriptional regulator [Rubripirellula sp.]